ncbi:spore photoproduct lyase family protein [Modestobacter sp. VKM Ac-2983]|uniref:spore photoproduct lyase family protein n=1 Tax=Modestobacter sp. VKM Ac-2983 TaxID=3004137 RepID=UPI002F269DC9
MATSSGDAPPERKDGRPGAVAPGDAHRAHRPRQLPADTDLTVECITHLFTPGSKATLTDWYPRTKLEMDEDARTTKCGKYGAVTHVQPRDTMTELRSWFTDAIADRLSGARLLYRT